jgi:hypothetical protein
MAEVMRACVHDTVVMWLMRLGGRSRVIERQISDDVDMGLQVPRERLHFNHEVATKRRNIQLQQTKFRANFTIDGLTVLYHITSTVQETHAHSF